MITDYKLLQANGNKALAAEVQRFINQGWEPHGSPIVDEQIEIYDNGSIKECVVHHYQAIIKRKPESDELNQLRWLHDEVADAVSYHTEGTIGEIEFVARVKELVHMMRSNNVYH